jgi:hypothetical protein
MTKIDMLGIQIPPTFKLTVASSKNAFGSLSNPDTCPHEYKSLSLDD